MLESPNYRALSTKAVKLLFDVAAGFRGNNNGDFSVTWSLMKERGWKSKSQMEEALSELQHYGFLEKTRQGGRHRASLYAMTWESIDDCKGKLDVGPTRTPSNLWMEERPPFVPRRKRKTKKLPRHAGQSTPRLGVISAN
jgi:hypothetical protein